MRPITIERCAGKNGSTVSHAGSDLFICRDASGRQYFFGGCAWGMCGGMVDEDCALVPGGPLAERAPK